MLWSRTTLAQSVALEFVLDMACHSGSSRRLSESLLSEVNRSKSPVVGVGVCPDQPLVSLRSDPLFRWFEKLLAHGL